MNFPAADIDRLTAALAPVVAGDVVGEDVDYSAALAYTATAEGTAAAIAERACDRCNIDFAACPVEILDAAERRAAELARAFLLEQVAIQKAAWADYNAAAAPFEAIKARIVSTKRRCDPVGKEWVAAENARIELSRIRCDILDASESALQARFGYSSWSGMDRGEFPRGWKP